MRGIRLTACVGALALTPLLLAACGGGSDSSQDEDDISSAITTVATKDDPSTCTELQTTNFVNQTSGSLKACQKDPSAQADSIDVTNVKVDGSKATADAAFSGGFIDGQTITLGLVKDGDQWKLDSIDGFAKFDRAKFTSGFLKEITSSEDAPPQAQACLQKQVANATDQQLEAIILTQNGGDAIFGPCFGGQ